MGTQRFRLCIDGDDPNSLSLLHLGSEDQGQRQVECSINNVASDRTVIDYMFCMEDASSKAQAIAAEPCYAMSGDASIVYEGQPYLAVVCLAVRGDLACSPINYAAQGSLDVQPVVLRVNPRLALTSVDASLDARGLRFSDILPVLRQATQPVPRSRSRL